MIVGLCLAVAYSSYIIIREWDRPLAGPTPQAADFLSNICNGAVVWFAGIALLGGLSWRAQVRLRRA